jgi:hypothetical protein
MPIHSKICTWNCRGLYVTKWADCEPKLKVLQQLLEVHDLVLIQESHITPAVWEHMQSWAWKRGIYVSSGREPIRLGRASSRRFGSRMLNGGHTSTWREAQFNSSGIIGISWTEGRLSIATFPRSRGGAVWSKWS